MSLMDMAGTHDDERFYIYYPFLSAAVKAFPEDFGLKRFFSALTRYMNGERLEEAELKNVRKESFDISEGLKQRQHELRVKGQEWSRGNMVLLGGVRSAYYLFEEIDSRQKSGVPFPAALRREVLGKAGMRHLQIATLEGEAR